MPFQKGNKINLGRKCSKEIRQKISKSLKGIPLSLETRQKMGKARMGKKNPAWKGGKYKCRNRWFIRKLNHPFADKDGYVRRSRLVAEKYLGRYLTPKEIVHHIGAKDDDRPQMLYVFPSRKTHNQYEHLKNKPKLKSNLFTPNG